MTNGGVPQGSCLSPILFNIFLRELPEACPTETFQFADDLTTFRSDKDINVIKTALQGSFQAIQKFCAGKGLSINVGNTQLILFKQATCKAHENFELDLEGTVILPEPEVKLL